MVTKGEKLSILGKIMAISGFLKFFVNGLLSIINTVKQAVKDLDDKNVSTGNALNFNRNQIMQCYNDLEKQLTKLEQAITKAESKVK